MDDGCSDANIRLVVLQVFQTIKRDIELRYIELESEEMGSWPLP